MNVRASKEASSKGSDSARPSTSSMRSARPAASTRTRPAASIPSLWSSPTTRQPCRRARAIGHGSRPGRDVEHARVRARLDAGDEEGAPARVLAEREQPRVAVVGRADRREQPSGGARSAGRRPRPRTESMLGPPWVSPRSWSRWQARPRRSRPTARRWRESCPWRPRRARGSTSVPSRMRAGRRTWLVTDDGGRAVTDRTRVRETASLAALCELAEENAAGGDLDDLRAQLVALRLTEDPPGIARGRGGGCRAAECDRRAAPGRERGAARSDRGGDPPARGSARGRHRVAVHAGDDAVRGGRTGVRRRRGSGLPRPARRLTWPSAHEALARGAHERHRLGEEHAHRVSERNGLLLGAAGGVHLAQRRRT